MNKLTIHTNSCCPIEAQNSTKENQDFKINLTKEDFEKNRDRFIKKFSNQVSTIEEAYNGGIDGRFYKNLLFPEHTLIEKNQISVYSAELRKHEEVQRRGFVVNSVSSLELEARINKPDLFLSPFESTLVYLLGTKYTTESFKLCEKAYNKLLKLGVTMVTLNDYFVYIDNEISIDDSLSKLREIIIKLRKISPYMETDYVSPTGVNLNGRLRNKKMYFFLRNLGYSYTRKEVLKDPIKRIEVSNNPFVKLAIDDGFEVIVL